ncbi:MAG: electron transfer flavoprotein subunit alpha/FixB family protein [Xanthobacteraceae bacterium]|nr:electron transfer flavoprotein subunit alpha/FixB family protein [Xanthobacteraceae bacterium]MBX3533426.1 electron transfer flavoprotein subunit alpha/FixB family protein [Xanthobacteraceae bacterium]MCW5676366.1 electron transfer flavoprotein subunit alpha/FixB family protein [Xanthobacteraceae bacterium]
MSALRVLVLAESSATEATPISLEQVALARKLAEPSGGQVSAIVLGPRSSDVDRQLISGGADKVYAAEESISYDPDVWVATISHLVSETSAGVVIFGHTSSGSDLAPRLAFRLSGSIATNCENAAIENGMIVATRVCYGGKARSVLRLSRNPAIITLRPGSLTPLAPDTSRVGETKSISANTEKARSKLLERKQEDVRGLRLETAKVVIGGGRGLGGPEGFKLLEQLASKLGAVVGASRVACDLGWCPPSMQIGLTGKTITPDLYIAVGISGASQHMAGCAGAKTIVAINSDAKAPIFADASIGIVGDYKELLPKILDEIQRLNS